MKRVRRWGEVYREKPQMTFCRLTLPSIIREDFNLNNAITLAEGDLVLLHCIVAAVARRKLPAFSCQCINYTHSYNASVVIPWSSGTDLRSRAAGVGPPQV